MKWAIVIVIVFICAFWFVGRIYSKTKDVSTKDRTQGVADNAGDSGSGADNGE